MNDEIQKRRQIVRCVFLVVALLIFWDMMRTFMNDSNEHPPERIALISAIFGFIAGWITAGAAFLFGGKESSGPGTG